MESISWWLVAHNPARALDGRETVVFTDGSHFGEIIHQQKSCVQHIWLVRCWMSLSVSLSVPLCLSVFLSLLHTHTFFFSHMFACYDKHQLMLSFCFFDECWKYGIYWKVLPIERGGGLDQKLLLDFSRKLAVGDWCHIFPEGKTVQVYIVYCTILNARHICHILLKYSFSFITLYNTRPPPPPFLWLPSLFFFNSISTREAKEDPIY